MTTTIPKQETCTPPTKCVPIIVEITDPDIKNAEFYGDIYNCLICTVLKREGYTEVTAGGTYVQIGGTYYFSDDIRPQSLNACNRYKGTTGKQIILYPQ